MSKKNKKNYHIIWNNSNRTKNIKSVMEYGFLDFIKKHKELEEDSLS